MQMGSGAVVIKRKNERKEEGERMANRYKVIVRRDESWFLVTKQGGYR